MKIIHVIIMVCIAVSTTAVYHITQSADINYYTAHQYFNKGRYDIAIPLYKKAIEIKPSYTNAIKELAYSLQYTADNLNAADAFLKYLSYNNEDNDVKKSLAETYSWMGEYDKAIALYEELLKKKDDMDTTRKLAEVFLWKGDYEKCLLLSGRVIDRKPGDVKAMLIYAQAAQYSGKSDQAAELYKRLLADHAIKLDRGDEEKIRKLLGDTYIQEKDYAGSVKQYRAVLDKEPSDLKTRIALADVLSWEKKYDEAAAEYMTVLKAQPGNAEVKDKLARIYSWNKDYKHAEEIYADILAANPKNVDARLGLGQLLSWQGRYAEAVKHFEVLLSQDKNNIKVMESLADVYSYDQEFKKAIFLYGEILKKGTNREVKRKLADVLSWDKQYTESLKSYDELLSEKEDAQIRLQKARVLGWAKDYDRSLNEYRKILSDGPNPLAETEMKAKSAYWNNRTEEAIRCYKLLSGREVQNTEALFDLSQIYAGNQMWQKAKEVFRNILDLSPEHFRAREGLEKSELVSERLLWSMGYEFTESDSQSRDTDIRKHIVFNKFHYPFNEHISLGVEQSITTRSFSDFGDLLENEERVKLAYVDNPHGWGEVYYDILAYSKGIKPISTFGGKINTRIFDIGSSTFSYERERLENTSSVIRNNFYSDNFKERIDLDITSRIKIGADYLYERYSDHNDRYEPGFDILYYFSLDPLRLSAKYRYFFREFKNKVSDYFSPEGFTTNSVEFNWRQYLNKKEIFYGADDIYYELGYTLSLDSLDIAGNKFTGGINWDVNKRLNLNIKGSFSKASAEVYHDSDIIGALKYYF